MSPILLLIAWRGEPGVNEEPQHIHQGRVTPNLLDAMDIPYIIIDSQMSQDEVLNSIIDQLDICNKEKKPVCVLVRKGTFETYKKNSNESPHNSLKLEREEAVEIAKKKKTNLTTKIDLSHIHI